MLRFVEQTRRVVPASIQAGTRWPHTRGHLGITRLGERVYPWRVAGIPAGDPGILLAGCGSSRSDEPAARGETWSSSLPNTRP